METPKLRGIEAFPMAQGGQRFIALRDPAGYTESILLLPQALVDVVALFDGEHSIGQIQADLSRRYEGENVTRADIDRIVSMLDEHGFLESPSFAKRRAKVDGAFLGATTRPASHAGGAYPAKPAGPRAAVGAFLPPQARPGVTGGP